MKAIEIFYANACINAALAARHDLLNMPLHRAVNKSRYGKSDTLGLDGVPEITIRQYVSKVSGDAILITEESDEQFSAHWSEMGGAPPIFTSDPTDRSAQFKSFLNLIGKNHLESTKVGDLLYTVDRQAMWCEMFTGQTPAETPELPLTIVSPTCAVTCILHGQPLFTAIVNYLADCIYIAGPMGAWQFRLPDYRNPTAVADIDLKFILNHGEKITFPSSKDVCANDAEARRCTTFLGKSGYQENFDATAVFLGENPRDFIHHQKPGGPTRILYLSELQRGHGPIGFVMSNGEKIGEFIHWLTFIAYCKTDGDDRSLSLFEVSIDRPWTKEGILMSTSPPYSIFRECPDGRHHFLDMRRLRKFKHPSHFRSTIVVTQEDNSAVRAIMGTNNYREIILGTDKP